MKPTRYILALLITVSTISLFAISSQQNCRKCESILQNNQGTVLDLTERIDIITQQNAELQKQIDTSKELLDKIDLLTRQNTVLMQEVVSQASQLDAYGEVYGE